MKEYHEKVEYLHLNPLRAALVGHPQDWRWSSFNEYAGMRPEEQRHRCGLTIDRVESPPTPGLDFENHHDSPSGWEMSRETPPLRSASFLAPLLRGRPSNILAARN